MTYILSYDDFQKEKLSQRSNRLQLIKESDEISNRLLYNAPVCQLSGNEFLKVEGKTLHQQVTDYFKSCGEKALTQFGEVFIDSKGVGSDLNHGMSRKKAVTFAAIKPTLENGTVILPMDYYRIHGKKQRTGIIAAPITIKEEKYICVVVVIDNKKVSRLYVHEVFLTKNLLEDVAVSIAVLGAETPVTHPQGEVAKILKNHIQDTYSKEEILNNLNNIQVVDNKVNSKEDNNASNENINKVYNITETNMIHIKRIDEMAVRFAGSIDNAVNSVKNTAVQQMKNAQEEANRILAKIYKYKDDMTDAIDTYKYVKQKGLERFIEKGLYDKSPISFKTGFYFYEYPLVIYMHHEENHTGDVSILFNGDNLLLGVVSRNGVRSIKVEDSIKGAFLSDSGNSYFKGGCSADYWRTKSVIDALTEFSDNIKDFLDDFFEKVQNIK